MTQFVLISFVVACFAAFLLTLLYKFGVIEYVQIRGNDFFHKMFSCDFCLSWWTSVVLCLFALLLTFNTEFLVVPFVSTLICKKLL